MPLRVSGNPTNIVTQDGRSKTSTHLSTNIYLAVDNGNGPLIVGAVQTITINESRDIAMIAEIGTDGFIDSAPRSPTKISGTCRRTRFDNVRIAEAFYRGFVHVHSQREPFDLHVFDLIKGDNENIAVTTIKNLWIKNIDVSIEAENYVIVENMGWDAESIQSIRDGKALASQVGININEFERQADIGEYRGALDAAGLLNAFAGSGR